MTDNNTWPGKPGVPLNPDREGWHHWLSYEGEEPCVYEWDGKYWKMGGGHAPMDYVVDHFTYIAPALTPAEVETRVKQAKRDALEKCISICNAVAHANRVEYPAKWKNRPEGIPHDWQQAWETCAETAEDIAATINTMKGEGHE
jgi:hypothetical protein